MKNVKVILYIFILCLSGFAESSVKNEISEKVGDMNFRYSPDKGASLSLFDMPLLSYSYIVAVSPGWTKHYYSSTLQKTLTPRVKVEPYKDGKKIVILHGDPSLEAPSFIGKETYTFLPENVFSADLEILYQGKDPAYYEWRVAGVNALPIMGRPFTASDDGATTRGIVPLKPAGSGIAECMVARSFKNVKIDSLLGPLEITRDPEFDIAFFDYRKNRWADGVNPVFWLGILERPIIQGKKYSHSVTIRFPGKFEKASPEIALKTQKLSRVKLKDAQIPGWEQDCIIPAPRRIQYLDLLFPISSGTVIYVGKDPSPGVEKGLDFFLQDLKTLYSIEPSINREEFPGGKTPMKLVLIGKIPLYQDLCNICDNFNLALPQHREGYSLFVHEDMACVGAYTDQGLFYGFTTLLQLMKVTDKGIFLKGAEIVDWPALDFRGIHCLSGKNAGTEIAWAERNLMARFKINSLVWECQYLVWDSHPEIAHPLYGMKKEDAQKVKKAAEDCFIEIIPLVQSLGHSEWIFTNRRNLDLAEDPETPYAYSPTNPKTYQFVFSVYQEALDFFQPRIFHIGHDEIANHGRFPFRSAASGKSLSELMRDDIRNLHAWFSQRGVRVMLWGDMFLWNTEGSGACLAPSLEDARKSRESLPRDVLIADWHYDVSNPERYTSLGLFKSEGFDAVGAAWYRPENIANLSQACSLYGVKGFLQTTWAGFNFKLEDNEKEWFQYWAYILAAHYAWTGDKTPPEKLPFKAQKIFLDLWSGKKPVLKKKGGFAVDLRSLCNTRLEDNERRDGWLGYGPDWDLSSFPVDQAHFDGVRFLVKKNERGEAAVLLSGKMNPRKGLPESAEMIFDPCLASQLHFLLTASFMAPFDTRSGRIVIRFDDGSEEVIPLFYGKNLFAFNDLSVGANAQILWDGFARSGEAVCVHELLWKNPRPEKNIRAILLESAGSEAAPILLAVTGVN